MRHICASHLPATNFDREQIEELARKIHGDLVHKLRTSIDGHSIVSVVAKIGGRREALELKYGDVVCEIEGRNDFILYLSEMSTELADRFSIAVGLGHYFLHANQGERPGCIHIGQVERTLWEAAVFASELLMPAATMMQLWMDTNSDTTKDIARTLGLRGVTVAQRCKALGLKMRDC